MAEGGFRHPNSGALIGGGFRRWWGRGWGQRTHSGCGQHPAARGSLAAEATGAGGSDLVTGGAGCVGAGMYRSFGFEDDRPVMVCPPPQILATAFHRRLTQTDAWLRQTLGRARPCHTAFSRRSLCRQGAAGAGRDARGGGGRACRLGRWGGLGRPRRLFRGSNGQSGRCNRGCSTAERRRCSPRSLPVSTNDATASRWPARGRRPLQPVRGRPRAGAGDAALRRRRRCFAAQATLFLASAGHAGRAAACGFQKAPHPPAARPPLLEAGCSMTALSTQVEAPTMRASHHDARLWGILDDASAPAPTLPGRHHVVTWP